MNRPPSILRFEQLYWASFALNLLAIALSWPVQKAALAANPQLAQLPWLLTAITLVRVVIVVLLWWLVARRASVVAKWIVVVFAAFAAFGALASLYALVLRTGGLTVPLVSLVASVLYVWAAVLLFRPDARLWFGELPASDELPPSDEPLP
jgi:hypothetical protein